MKVLKSLLIIIGCALLLAGCGKRAKPIVCPAPAKYNACYDDGNQTCNRFDTYKGAADACESYKKLDGVDDCSITCISL